MGGLFNFEAGVVRFEVEEGREFFEIY